MRPRVIFDQARLTQAGAASAQAGGASPQARPLLPAAAAALRHPAVLARYLQPPCAGAALPSAAAAACSAATTQLLMWLLSAGASRGAADVSSLAAYPAAQHPSVGSGHGAAAADGAAGPLCERARARAAAAAAATAALCAPLLQRCAYRAALARTLWLEQGLRRLLGFTRGWTA